MTPLDKASHVEEELHEREEPTYSTVVKGHKRAMSTGGRTPPGGHLSEEPYIVKENKGATCLT